MAKRKKTAKKPKPATAGEKMLLITVAGHKRAIARAVSKERRRCLIIANVHREKWIMSSNEIRMGVKP